MDRMNRPSGPQGPRAFPPHSPESLKSDSTYSNRSVRQIPARTRFTRHPFVLKMELRQRIGERTINRLRDLARANRLPACHTSHEGNIEDDDLCEQAKVLSSQLKDLVDSDASDDQLGARIRTLLEQTTGSAEDQDARQKLLHIIASDDFTSTGTGLFTTLNDIYEHFQPHTLSIFLQTHFGQHVLNKLQSGETPDPDEHRRMLLGLTHIKSRLDVRPAGLSDVPLVEYANLYMGQDIDLDHFDGLYDITLQTLERIIEQRNIALYNDTELMQDLHLALKAPLTKKRLPLTKNELKALRSNDSMFKLYQKLTAHPKLNESLQDGQLSLDDLQQALRHLERSRTSHIDNIVALEKQQYLCKEIKDEGRETRLVKIAQILESSVQHCGNIIERQALSLLKDHVDYQMLEAVHQDFEKQLHEQLKFLEEGGTEKTFTVSVNIGLALSAAQIQALNIGGKLEYTFKVTGNDDTKVREFHTVKPSLTISGGDKKIAMVAAETGYDYTKGRVFRSLEELIHFHSNDFVPMLLGSMSKLPKNAVGVLNVRRAQKLFEDVTANRHLLSQRLTQLGAIAPGDRVRVEQAQPVNYADFEQHARRVEMKIKALAGLVSGKVASRNSATHFTTRTNRLLMLRNNPEQAKPPTRKYLSFWTPASELETEYYTTLKEKAEDDSTGEVARQLEKFKEEDGLISRRLSHTNAIAWIETTQKLLEHLRVSERAPGITREEAELLRNKRLTIRDQLKKAMVDQYLERDMYYYTVNAMEGHIGEEAPQKHFHTAKHSMQEVYGAKDRGQFIAAHTYSFYNLHKLYENTFLPGETPVVNDAVFHQVLESHIEPSLETPQIHLENVKHVRKSMTASAVAISTERRTCGVLKLAIPKTNITTSADFTFSRIGKHVNPDSDGKYLTVGLNLGTGVNPITAINALNTALSQQQLEDSDFPDIPLAGEALESLAKSSLNADTRIEFHFVRRNKGWRQQYTRISGKKGLGISSPDIGIPTGPIGEAHIKASGSVTSIHNWWERPGNNTLSYMYAKFNGWKAAQMIKKPSWEISGEKQTNEQLKSLNPFSYYAKTHKKAISEMLANMGNERTSIASEMTDMLAQIDTNDPAYYPGFIEDFTDLLRAHAENPDPDNMDRALEAFERFLTLQHKVYLKEARSRYQSHYRKGRII